MRVCQVITRTEAGGAQVHLRDLARGFRGLLDIQVLAGGDDGPGWLRSELAELGIPLILLPPLTQPIRPLHDLRALFICRRVLRSLKPDLLHCHSSKAGLIGRLAAKSLGIPSVFTAHGFAFTPGTPLARRWLALGFEWIGGWVGDGIITVSEYDKRLALRHGVAHGAPVWTVHNGVPDVSVRACPAREPPVIVMVGRFSRPKDQRLLVEALTALRELSWECWFVGEGPTEGACRTYVEQRRLEGKVRFLGTRRDVPDVLAKCQIFVLASNWEGLPLSVLEAMRAGLPVVASDVGGTREAIADGETGFLVPRGDAVALRDRLLQLIQNPSLRLQMGRAGRARYERFFTVDRMLQRTWEVYRLVLAKHGKALPRWEEAAERSLARQGL
ncbi:glycosyltransferase family 4 protein [Limisphaera sp. 4302-co]|uniref:glycosyltransferase family 4 protein n=1 Tax=Limisphaera sp. 4302-co TaxID=3400417 RepID=UPI003C25AB40